MAFQSTKTYGHEEGLSCAFRQWRANHSHCQLLHGYALSFKFTFESEQLDERGWVMDFGGLKHFKTKLKATFDHRVAVAGDDPNLDMFMQMHEHGIADVLVFPNGVGVEKFARTAWGLMDGFIRLHYADNVKNYGLRVVSCECAEHGANSAIYIHEQNER